MKRWLKRLAGCAGVLLLLLVVVLATEHFRGKWALTRRLRELQANGEQFSISALEPKRPDADQNTFLVLAALTNQFENNMTNLGDLPPVLRFGAPGKAIVVWRMREWSYDGKITNSWSRIGPKLEDARDLLDLIHAAVNKPAYDCGFDYHKGFVDFRIGPLFTIKRSAEVLNVAAAYELSRGRIEEAYQHLHALVGLAAAQKPEPLIICQLVRLACAGFAFDGTWQALQASGWNDTQLASLQTAWEGCDFENDMALAFEMEQAMQVDFYSQLKASNDKLTLVLTQREEASEFLGKLPTHGFVLNWLYIPLWRVAWVDQDELMGLNRWQFYIKHERAVRSNSWAAIADNSTNGPASDDVPRIGMGDDENSPGWYDRLRFLFSNEVFSITDNIIRKAVGAQVQQQMAVTAIALDRYKLRSGTLPSNLNALVPDFLKAPPRDRMDGKTLSYRLLPGGGYVLYSVGEDGKDDGGNPALRPGKDRYRRIWDGRDAVWPTAATPDEAAAAMKPVGN